ncbi:hypothetical protein O6H91_17G079800 [Diphasiastrum complanatum]|uniref:Uncharacterized protein n=1 Tax=Diphasiastrum complanatum TaxID=34168 RepID=A0ACC2B8G6_DIPCM|nr:hypothetical protein O6H91_17G079800 [Diphasiastrum complanatum]
MKQHLDSDAWEESFDIRWMDGDKMLNMKSASEKWPSTPDLIDKKPADLFTILGGEASPCDVKKVDAKAFKLTPNSPEVSESNHIHSNRFDLDLSRLPLIERPRPNGSSKRKASAMKAEEMNRCSKADTRMDFTDELMWVASNSARNTKKSALEQESHILTERQRRKKMSCMFSSLQSLLPGLCPKADKSTVIDEAISYIRSLEKKMSCLSLKVAARRNSASNISSPKKEPLPSSVAAAEANKGCLFQTMSFPNAMLNVSGEDAFITIRTSRKQLRLEDVFSPFEKEQKKLKVLNAHISANHTNTFYMIHAQVNAFQESAADVFQAALEDIVGFMETSNGGVISENVHRD